MAKRSMQIARLSALMDALGADLPFDYCQSLFWALTDFLQKHELTSAILAKTRDDIREDFVIHTDDLAEEGFQFMKKTFHKWLDVTDEYESPDDVSYLEKQLKKMRG